jgi:hypothetical protein
LQTLWKFADVIDLEALIARDGAASAPLEDAAGFHAAIHAAGSDPAAARRAGLRFWLAERRRADPNLPGTRWEGARLLVAMLVCTALFLAGVSAVLGLLDRSRGGFNVPVFLGITLGVQWLILLAAATTWLLRARLGAGLALIPSALGALIDRLIGERRPAWWRALLAEGGRYRAVLLWPLVRVTQAGGMSFNAGLLAGLVGCLWFLNVGFFWESTTPGWMQQRLGNLTSFMAAPWSWAEPTWHPSAAEIAATRIGTAPLDVVLRRADAWYPFLLASIAVWGFVPRLALWLAAARASRRALAGLDFQARRHRELWRVLTGVHSAEPASRPLDGVIVLDVGGSGLTIEALRPFLLRRLRVNPVAWLPVAVMDPGSEAQAAAALAAAPAGVVFLAEGWALSPPRMSALHRRTRAAAGAHTPVLFLVANVGHDGAPTPPTSEEQNVWARFVDELADPAAEVFFFSPLEGSAD